MPPRRQRRSRKGQRQGYEADGPEAIEINETIEVSGVSRDVSVSTWSVTYSAPADQTAMFLFSTPNVEALGVSVNPLARLSGADLIVRLLNEGLGRAGEDMAVEGVEQETELTAAVLGEERTIPVFSATLDTGSSGSASGIEGDRTVRSRFDSISSRLPTRKTSCWQSASIPSRCRPVTTSRRL
jgi:hypothetical protein